MAHFRALEFFLSTFTHHQLLDTVARYHNMQTQQKLMHNSQEDGLKPHLGPFLAGNGPF